jgi:hypothetical protein
MMRGFPIKAAGPFVPAALCLPVSDPIADVAGR